MSTTSLSEALTREHRDIDAGIETFVADLDRDVVDPKPLLVAFEALRRHIYLEETFLFPPIRQAGMMMPILVMLREHGTLWQLMDALSEQVASHDPAGSNDALRSACSELQARLDQHNEKEEPVVYPQADVDLDEAAAAGLAAFLRTGSTPDGWVCEAAGQPGPAA